MNRQQSHPHQSIYSSHRACHFVMELPDVRKTLSSCAFLREWKAYKFPPPKFHIIRMEGVRKTFFALWFSLVISSFGKACDAVAECSIAAQGGGVFSHGRAGVYCGSQLGLIILPFSCHGFYLLGSARHSKIAKLGDPT